MSNSWQIQELPIQCRTLVGRARWSLQKCVPPKFPFCLVTFAILFKKLIFWLVVPFPSSPVKDLLLCPLHTTSGLTGLLALQKLCQSMRKAEHMVFGLYFWYHKAGPGGLTLDYVPLSDIRPSEKQPVLICLCSTSPVTLPQDILWYCGRVLLSPLCAPKLTWSSGLPLKHNTDIVLESEHSVRVWAHADAQVHLFTSRFSEHTLCWGI